jgi:hypothetical protein
MNNIVRNPNVNMPQRLGKIMEEQWNSAVSVLKKNYMRSIIDSEIQVGAKS